MVEVGDRVVLFNSKDKHFIGESATPEVGDIGTLINASSFKCFLPKTSVEVGDTCRIFSTKDKYFARGKVDWCLLNSISPSRANSGDDTILTINGANFKDCPEVTLDSFDLINESFIDSTQILATISSSIPSGIYDVICTNPSGAHCKYENYLVYLCPYHNLDFEYPLEECWTLHVGYPGDILRQGYAYHGNYCVRLRPETWLSHPYLETTTPFPASDGGKTLSFYYKGWSDYGSGSWGYYIDTTNHPLSTHYGWTREEIVLPITGSSINLKFYTSTQYNYATKFYIDYIQLD